MRHSHEIMRHLEKGKNLTRKVVNIRIIHYKKNRTNKNKKTRVPTELGKEEQEPNTTPTENGSGSRGK